MIGNDEFLFLGKDAVFFLIAGDDNLDTLLKVCLSGKTSAVTDCTKRCLVDDVCKLCSGGSGGSFCNVVEVYVICDLDLFRMNLQNLLTALEVRKLYWNPAVETARTKKSRVKGIRTVGGCQNNNALGTVETIHLGQQLVQGLLTLVVSADLAVTLFTDGIDLIDEYDTGRFFLGLFKKITNLGGAHTNEHLYEFRTGNGEEGNLRLTGYSFCKKGFTCSRRAYKKGSFRHLGTDLTVFLGIVKEIYDLLQKLLRLILTCYI